jgi:hypothetical protein
MMEYRNDGIIGRTRRDNWNNGMMEENQKGRVGLAPPISLSKKNIGSFSFRYTVFNPFITGGKAV